MTFATRLSAFVWDGFHANRVSQFSPNVDFRFLPLAVVLVIAALGKAWWLPLANRVALFQQPGVLYVVVALEIIAAAWFVWMAGRFPTFSKNVATLIFGTFAVYSANAWVRGEPCQCFGGTSLSSLVPLTIDVSALAWLWWPRKTRLDSTRLNSTQLNSTLVGFCCEFRVVEQRFALAG